MTRLRSQAICDGLDEDTITGLARKWLAILPHPFTAEDTAAGFCYELSVLEAEFSLAQTLDSPASGRVLFEDIIRGNLDAGPPDRVSLVFGRRIVRKGPRATPGRFRTRVLTSGVDPSLHVDYKASGRARDALDNAFASARAKAQAKADAAGAPEGMCPESAPKAA